MIDRRAARLALGFACAGHAAMHVLTALYLTVVLSLEAAWGLGYDRLIGLWTLGALMVGLGAPIAGWAGDRWGEARLMVLFFLATGAGTVAAGLTTGPLSMTIALAALGLGGSIFHPVGLSWVVGVAENRGRALGIVGLFGAVGVGFAALIAGALTTVAGWRAAFLVPGVLSILAGLVLAAAIAAGRVPLAGRKGESGPPAGRGDLIRAFVILTVTMAAMALVFSALQTAMPRWFELRMDGLIGEGGLGLGTLGVGALVSAVYVMVAFSQFAGGWAVDRWPVRSVYLVGLTILLPLIAVCAVLAEAPLFLAVTLALFVHGALVPAETLLLARYSPAGRRGLAFGARFVLAFGIAPVAVQIVARSYAATGGFAVLLLILATGIAVALMAAAFLPGGRAAEPQAVPAE